jgi:hypothetical protein
MTAGTAPKAAIGAASAAIPPPASMTIRSYGTQYNITIIKQPPSHARLQLPDRQIQKALVQLKGDFG